MKTQLMSLLALSLWLPTSSWAACAGTGGAVYALEQVGTSTTNSSVDTSNKDIALITTLPVVKVTFSVTASSGHCGYTCAGVTDSHFPNTATYTESTALLLSTTNSYANRNVDNFYVSNTPAAPTQYTDVELQDSNTCTCQETIGGNTTYFHKVCVLP